jgi:ATPase subunit of ABC transporter with duplicated ATPase domains
LLRLYVRARDHVNYRGNYVYILDISIAFTSADAMNMEVSRLSGGEQSRLLMAKMMLKEANVLVLDEPTNDLDIGDLQVLEQCLQEFPGAVILVTHDSYFLDQVAHKLSPSARAMARRRSRRVFREPRAVGTRVYRRACGEESP